MNTLRFEPMGALAFLDEMARQIQVPLLNNRLTIPDWLGEGHIQAFVLDEGFELITHQYTFGERMEVNRLASQAGNDVVSVFFCYSESIITQAFDRQPALSIYRSSPAGVVVSTADIASTFWLPPGERISLVVLTLTRRKLLSYFGPDEVNAITTLFRQHQPLLLYEDITLTMQQTMHELMETDPADPFRAVLLKAAALRLLYILFHKINNRDTVMLRRVGQADVGKLFAARNLLLGSPTQAMPIAQLARQVGLSESKLKHLFKLIFGDSIYNYHLTYRMQEARRLIETGMLVSEAATLVGFSNLSHFARLFQRLYGRKPVQWRKEINDKP